MKDEENEGSTQPLLVHRAFSPAWSQIQRKPLLVLPETPRPSPKRPSTWSRFAQALVRLGRMGRKSHSHAQYAGPNPFVSPTSTPVYRASWAQHWQSLGQPWRTEPEIDIARQRQLMRCRQDGSLAGLSLTRADIEWLLSNHMQSHMPQHTRHASLFLAMNVKLAN